jgi:hypothetical protein
MTTEKTSTELTFEEIASDVIADSKQDREKFLEVIEAMQNLASTNADIGVIMMEQIVKGYDVLNKMNAQRSALASVVLKSRRTLQDTDQNEDVFGDIGDLNSRISNGDNKH